LPSDLKIKWADVDTPESFFEDNCVIVRIKKANDPNSNYTNIVYQFVHKGLMQGRRDFFNERIMRASDLLLTNRILLKVKPSANQYFNESYYSPAMAEDIILKEDYDRLVSIEKNGMLFHIYFNELYRAMLRVEDGLPDPCLQSESSELLSFLNGVAHRQREEHIDLTFKSNYFNIAIVLAASNPTMRFKGTIAYRNYLLKLLDDNYETIYIFAIGEKVAIAKQIATEFKAFDGRIIKTVARPYTHIFSDKRRMAAVCIELGTY